MIMFKKSYAEQLLQLALTLSLLRVNPNNYLGIGWQSQLALNNGDGWQLELQATPVYGDYPYSNRKALLPLIDDLVRFDRYRQTPYDVQTYLLNIQNEQATADAAVQQSPQQSQQNNDSAIAGLHHQQDIREVVIDQHLLAGANSAGLTPNELDIFLNSDHFTESESILEQNLADLNDYGEHYMASFPYAGLPLKDEPPSIYNNQIDPVEIKIEPTTSATSDLGGSLNSTSEADTNSTYGGQFVEWSDFYNIKKAEEDEENDDDEGVAVGQQATELIKKEEAEEDEHLSTIKSEDNDLDDKNSTSGFSSSVELTEEESEIIEVLWKQDVDLGYSLAPPILTTNLDTKTGGVNVAEDEDEKLKALQELKHDEKDKDLSEDEWSGIQFTIDNETGEYIQLPLQFDEILQDVLQLADLTSDDQEDEDKIPDNVSQSSETTAAEKLLDEATKALTDNNDCDKDANKSTDDQTDDQDLLEKSLSDGEISTNLSHINLDDANDLDEIDRMIQSVNPFQHPRAGQNYGHGANTYRQPYGHQSRVPISRAVSMEQRLQDIANYFNPIPGMGVADMASYPHHYPSHYSYQTPGQLPQHTQFSHPHSHAVLHNASLAELGTPQPHYGPNLGTAVSSSMHITNSSHESDGGASGYKMDHDNMMYFSNTSSELNHTTDGFINSILNDEDLQLMDMGVNEGFYTMRMLENSTSNNSSILGASSNVGLSSSHASSNGVLGGGGGVGLVGSTTLHPQTNLSSLGAIGSTGDRLDASSDSAVSSMGSERVPSLSDSEWGDAGSDSAQDYHHRNSSKYGGPYDYSSYSSRLSDSPRHPVAQKKHHMFGKRYFQEQSNLPPLPQTTANQSDIPIKYEYEPYGMHQTSTIPHSLEGAAGPLVSKHQAGQQSEMKYSCSLDFARQNRDVNELIGHNHTYTLPQGTGASPRPQARDKKQRRLDDEHLSRDEKRARALNIPMAVQEIINLPMDEFNERLSKFDLSEVQLSLIRDIRRRGKNKVAAQNCRKRKLDQIICLADEVKEVRKRKDRLYRERDMAVSAHENIKRKFATLHKHIFQNLRDPDGNPYSPNHFSLQQSVDGSIHVLPKDNNKDGVRNINNPQHHGGSSNHGGGGGGAGGSGGSAGGSQHHGHHPHHQQQQPQNNNHHHSSSHQPHHHHHHQSHHPHHPKE